MANLNTYNNTIDNKYIVPRLNDMQNQINYLIEGVTGPTGDTGPTGPNEMPVSYFGIGNTR